MKRQALLFAAALSCLTLPARALTPDDIVVIFNTQSPNSLKVARYYMSARKIPEGHLCPITCPAAEGLTEEIYRTAVVPQVRKWLAEHKLESTKCLVTTYDVPLRIFARQPTGPEQKEIAEDQKQLEQTLNKMEATIGRYDAILPPPAPASTSHPATTQAATTAASAPAVPRTWQAIVARVNTAANNAGRRIEAATDPARTVGMRQFVDLQQQVAGVAGLLNALHVGTDAPADDPGRVKLAELQAQLTGIQQQYSQATGKMDQPEARQNLAALRQQGEGLVGEARALEELIAYLKPDGTEACFDNELALVLANQTYPRTNWVTNPLCVENWPTTQRLRAALATRPNAAPAAGPNSLVNALLVARIDGATPEKAIAMIDLTKKTEEKGLAGKIYLDARGLHGTDGYAAFDADLRKAADWLKQHSTMEVVLDDTDKLFEAKDAPDCALYCGWYSLRNYQDSCQWVPGAVGYHVASLEMISLHDPNEKGWAVNLLNHNFCGTLGATDEPFLHAFPKPSLFFPLLMCGEFTQGEVWQVTDPLLSWRIGYVGDPLYNPFKAKPMVAVKDLKEHPVMKNAWEILRP